MNKINPPATRKSYRQLASDLKAGVKGTFNLARSLPQFFRERITVQRAEEEIKKALETREERFLALTRDQIYERPGSPYLKLPKIAGCEFSDLRTQVRRYGLEATLERLAREGVYLTSGEFKGKQEVVRGGEPFTESKRGALTRVGAGAVPDYAFEGGGPVGVGCANPTHLDEMHVQQHIMALIAHPKLLDAGVSTARPLLCTTIHSGYARLLFNVENGDYATLERRKCGCALEKAGLTLHLHHIRSYEKFTSEGDELFLWRPL